MYRVFKKNVFFPQSVQPNPHRVRDQLILARDLSVLLLAGHFLNDQWQPSAGERQVLTFWKFLGKKHNFPEHSAYYLLYKNVLWKISNYGFIGMMNDFILFNHLFLIFQSPSSCNMMLAGNESMLSWFMSKKTNK